MSVSPSSRRPVPKPMQSPHPAGSSRDIKFYTRCHGPDVDDGGCGCEVRSAGIGTADQVCLLDLYALIALFFQFWKRCRYFDAVWSRDVWDQRGEVDEVGGVFGRCWNA